MGPGIYLDVLSASRICALSRLLPDRILGKAKQLGRGFLRQTICSTSLMRRVQEILPVGTAVGLRAAPKGH